MAALKGLCLFCVLFLNLCGPSAAFALAPQAYEDQDSAVDVASDRPHLRKKKSDTPDSAEVAFASDPLHLPTEEELQRQKEEQRKLLEKRKVEEAESRKRKTEGAQRRMASEENRSAKLKMELAKRQEEQKRLSELKIERRNTQMSSLQKQEERLAAKIERFERVDGHEANKVKAERKRADVMAHAASEARSKAESIGDHLKERLRNRTAEREAEHAILVAKRDVAHEQLTLEQQAVELRKANQEREYFPLPSREDPLAFMNTTDVTGLVKGFIGAARSTKFMSQLKATVKEINGVAAAYRYNSTKKIASLMSTLENSSDQEFVPQLANFFRQSSEELGVGQAQCRRSFKYLQNTMPGLMSRRIAPLLAPYINAPLVNASLDAAKMEAATSLKDGCAQLHLMMGRITSTSAGITQVEKVLNASARAYPKLDVDEKIGRVPQEALSVMQSLVHVGYLETISIGGVVKQIVEQVGPVISYRCAGRRKRP